MHRAKIGARRMAHAQCCAILLMFVGFLLLRACTARCGLARVTLGFERVFDV